MKQDLNAPIDASTSNDEEWVTLVGQGSLGSGTTADDSRITRAYLTPVEENGRYAWWVGPENQKAKVNLANRPRDLSPMEWEIAAGGTSEIGISSIDGLEPVDDSPNEISKVFSQHTLELVEGLQEDEVRNKFFDLTAHSKGPLVSVRSGHLKKDLSLLFENDNSDLPDPYQFVEGTDLQEPSIRPMSPELLAEGPRITGRHFQSWTNMRHFYRMYRSDSDSTVRGFNGAYSATGGGGTGGRGHLVWQRGMSYPYTEVVASCNNTAWDRYDRWTGSNQYWRTPVLTKLTYIFSTLTIPNLDSSGNPTGGYRCQLTHTPVLTYWNPYNVRLRIPRRTWGVSMSAYPNWPFGFERYLGNSYLNFRQFDDSGGRGLLDTRDGSDIVFEPGQFIQFCPDVIGADSYSNRVYLYPGFNPQAYGGMIQDVEMNAFPSQNRGFAMSLNGVAWALNVQAGNTPGSLTFAQYWTDNWFTSPHGTAMPMVYQNDWFNVSQQLTPVTPAPRGAYNHLSTTVTHPGRIIRWNYADPNVTPFAYVQMVLKGSSTVDYETVDWDRDWRGRNWLYSPGHYFGHGLYASEDDDTLHTQRLENPYVINFGEIAGQIDLARVVNHHPSDSSKPFLGVGTAPFEKINRAPAIELPTAPITSLAGFSGMRINPGWTHARDNFPHLHIEAGTGRGARNRDWSLYAAENKVVAYQSGVTGPGIGNSFMHPMLNRDGVYRYANNSVSQDPNANRWDWANTESNDTLAYCDYWDHVFLLNDALWDDYFLSSIGRPGRFGDTSVTSNDMIDRMVSGGEIYNSRFMYESHGEDPTDVADELKAADGYLKTAGHLMVDGMFNVNSTSVDAWHALFSGIRERQLVYRDGRRMRTIQVPDDKAIAVSRFNTPVFGEEMTDVEYGIDSNGDQAWSGVRFLDDDQLRKLAEECVKQVKLRGPFLNFSEFINRRLSDDELGTLGALQAAIDYDDDRPEPGSINYAFKSGPDFMMSTADLGDHIFGNPDAVNGSRFAGIPGYVIQSDILKPISNTMSVRDDTFRIRAYGEALNSRGEVIARAWCEAIIQRTPEYTDPANDDHEAARLLQDDGSFIDNPALTPSNLRFGRKFVVESFRWLNPSEV